MKSHEFVTPVVIETTPGIPMESINRNRFYNLRASSGEQPAQNNEVSDSLPVQPNVVVMGGSRRAMEERRSGDARPHAA